MGLLNDDAASETVDDAVEPSSNPLTTNGGTRIDWGTVVAVASGIFSTAFFNGMAEFIRGLFEAYLIAPLRAVGDLAALLLEGLLGAVPATIRGSFQAAGRWVEGLGPFAFIGALGIVLLTAYVVARGLNRE
jgi:hypothetical protein